MPQSLGQHANNRPPSHLQKGDNMVAKIKEKKELEIVLSQEQDNIDDEQLYDEDGEDVNDDDTDEMIPDELLFALTQMSAPHDDNDDGEVNEKGESIKEVMRKGPPANVWHHKSRRSNFRHLTDHPRSHGTGVGTRDVSFIYDANKKAPRPPSQVRKSKTSDRKLSQVPGLKQQQQQQTSVASLNIPESVIPDEFHIVKSKAVLGLEYIDQKDTTGLLDVDHNLRIFPSLNPSKRYEVVQLLKTFDYMLHKSGVNNEEGELSGPSQLHHLLEIVKKEQKIYDLAFSEIIRQVSVGCVERGQLLSKIRTRYADLISRIPRQIKSLHAEILAQRALDRRLTEELARFKSSITYLTRELKEMKEREIQVTEDAGVAEVELAHALEESQTNANLVEEYHSLYELQRKRLEEQITTLTKEKEMWSKSALSISRKVMDGNKLKTSKRLNMVDKSWSKLAHHFSVLLNDHDAVELTQVQTSMSKWREMMFEFNTILDTNDKRTEDFLNQLDVEAQRWISYFDDSVISLTQDQRRAALPTMEIIEELNETFDSWDKKLVQNLQRFASEQILDHKEQFAEMKLKLTETSETALNVFRRHKTKTGEVHMYNDRMIDIVRTINELENQLQTRVNGENGLLEEMRKLHSKVTPWNVKLQHFTISNTDLEEGELLHLYDRLHEMTRFTDRARKVLRSQQNLYDKRKTTTDVQQIEYEQPPHIRLEAFEVMNNASDWLQKSVRGIEAMNGKLLAQASSIHSRMTHWMVQSLTHLAPDFNGDTSSRSSSVDSLSTVASISELEQQATHIVQDMTDFTTYMSECVSEIVEAKRFESKNLGIEEPEWIDFNQFKQEAKSWIETAENVMKSMTGSNIKLTTDEIDKKLGIKTSAQIELAKKKQEKKEKKAEKRQAEQTSDNDEDDSDVSSGTTSSENEDIDAELESETKRIDQDVQVEKKMLKVEGGKKQKHKKQKVKTPISSEESTKTAGSQETESQLEQMKSDSYGTAPQLESSQESPRVVLESSVSSNQASSSVKESTATESIKESTTTESSDTKQTSSVETEESHVNDVKDEVHGGGGGKRPLSGSKKKKHATTHHIGKIPLFMESAGDASISEHAVHVTQLGEIEIETLADDENVVNTLLTDATFKELQAPKSKLTQSAYDAIAKVNDLQAELISTEKRAQSAESKVVDLQEEVIAANHKIRNLEVKVRELQEAIENKNDEQVVVNLSMEIEEQSEEDETAASTAARSGAGSPTKSTWDKKRKSATPPVKNKRKSSGKK